MRKKKHVTVTSPEGIARYPWLNEPDTKFDADGVYKVELVIPKDEAQTFIGTIQDVADKAMEEFQSDNPRKKLKTAPLPIKDHVDDDGNETGDVAIKFKLKAIGGSGANTWEQRPVLFDSKLRPMTENIGGGSNIRVGCEVVPYNSPTIGVGVTLRLKSVQCLNLIEYGGAGADAWEFDTVEGFVSTGETNTNKNTSEVIHTDEGHDF